ncbi:MAG TPA: GPP34 family phosphoprotein, partial [Mycobacterium sp.]|nr:GPP34 family phosphoprotein [Mycobacterium sp.]
ALLEQGPLTPKAAIAALRKRAEDDVLDQLLRTGQLHQVELSTGRLRRRREYAWPINNRARAEGVRAAVMAALFDRHRPDPPTATVIALLASVNGLGAAFSLNERGWRWVHDRANEIASGCWVDEADLADVNLAVTTAAVRAALG